MKPIVLILAVTALCVFGCKPQDKASVGGSEPDAKAPTASVVGKWLGTFELGEGDLEAATAEEAEQAREFFATLTLDLEILEDGTYTMVSPDGKDSGTWAMKEGKLSLTDKNADADSPYRDQVFEIEDGGKRLVGRDPVGESDSLMVFTRV